MWESKLPEFLPSHTRHPTPYTKKFWEKTQRTPKLPGCPETWELPIRSQVNKFLHLPDVFFWELKNYCSWHSKLQHKQISLWNPVMPWHLTPCLQFFFNSLLQYERGPSSLIGCVSVLDEVPAGELVSSKETCVFTSESWLCRGLVGDLMTQA